ncbi:MAG: hypothetical protein ACI4UY_14110 [Kiritimatiellia bacterium]
MDKTVERYLLEHGHEVVRAPRGAGASCGDGQSPGDYGEWFDEKVLGLDSEGYRRAFWREAHATGHTIGHVPRTLDTLLHEQCGPRADAQCGFLLAVALLQGGIYPFWLLARLLTREINRLRRGTYYARERERRHRLADERRAIRVRRTVNPKPSLGEIRAAWDLVRATRGREHTMAVLRLGALLEDLERYVDNHAYVTRGVPGIRGRAPGIKGLFAKEAPDLREDYKSVMRCKALAKRYRQACDCSDPIPEEALLPARAPAAAPASTPGEVSADFAAERPAEGSDPSVARRGTRAAGGMLFPAFPCLDAVEALRAWMAEHGNTAYLRTQSWAPRPEGTYSERNLLRAASLELAAEILRFGDGTLVALEAAVALRIDPDCVARDSVPGLRVETLLGGHRPLRVAGRVRTWLSRRRGAGSGAMARAEGA